MFFCLLCFGIIYSQNTISGKIVDENNMALEKSHIHISSKSTNSKKDGTFIIRNIPNGSAKVLITYVGYKPIDTIIEVNGNLEINFQMKQKSEQLEEIVVKHKNNYFNHSVSEQKIKEKTIEKTG